MDTHSCCISISIFTDCVECKAKKEKKKAKAPLSRCELGTEQLQLEQLFHVPGTVTLPGCVKTLLSHHRPKPEVPPCANRPELTAPLSFWLIFFNSSSNSHDPSPVLHTNNSHPLTHRLLLRCVHRASNTKCFLLPSVYI